MGWSVSRHSDPARKLLLLDRRIAGLRGAIKGGYNPAQIAKQAKKVRLATLALIKAKQALIREYPARDADGRQSLNLEQEKERWSTLPTEVIVAQYGEIA